MRGVSHLGYRSDRAIDRRRFVRRPQPRSADLHLKNFNVVTQIQSLCNPANASATMHAVDPQRKFRQDRPLFIYSILVR